MKTVVSEGLKSIMEKNQEKVSPTKNLFKKDCSRFKKYIQSSSTADGVVYIFIGKSYIRKAFWLLIVLTCASACLYNIIDRIQFLASSPTTTTFKLTRQQKIDFPAVTICNLNMLRRDYLRNLSLSDAVFNLLLSETQDGEGNCSDWLQSVSDLPNITYQQLFATGKQDLENLIIGCQYLGHNCRMENIQPTLTQLGVCYVFNSGQHDNPIMKTDGTGIGLGLRVILNVSQNQYAATPNLDAGVKIAVHHQSEPPQPYDRGIAVAPGTNAFVNIRQLNVVDETEDFCNTNGDVVDFNFLQTEFNYSEAACTIDCFYTKIANSCNCALSGEYRADKEPFRSLPPCTIRDTCCVLLQQAASMSCSCPPPCKASIYKMTSSYSSFPANLYSAQFSNNYTNLQEDLVMVNIFYESLSITSEVTSRAYDIIALLSDIGGQLGLFLGISVISVVEFAVWVLDEVKDRCLGISERKMKRLCCKREAQSDRLEMRSDISEYYSKLSDHDDGDSFKM